MPHLKTRIRDAAALLLVMLYMLPIVWWGLSAFTPADVLLDLPRFLSMDFSFTLSNFALVILGVEGTIFDSRDSLVDSTLVALLSTAIVTSAALPLAYALSQMTFRWQKTLRNTVILQRFMPPIAIVFPLVGLYHTVGLLDTRLGVALAHAALNLPFAVLLLKSFLDDVPLEVTEAARLDGATRYETFRHVILPLMKGGIAATAILCFIFSWTEFLLSLFLTQNMRLMPVQAGVLVMNMWGLISALTTTALIPAFLFVLVVQKHLVRGLTLGIYR
ncbi:carbohydrate ABC transporter permease [Aestuariivirga sp.]|uniref:carbohydrate ABC transporter permease n=1 Tax=Aestuariivirga sp. TaxID=2650926 RepID=UPI0039E55806